MNGSRATTSAERSPRIATPYGCHQYQLDALVSRAGRRRRHPLNQSHPATRSLPVGGFLDAFGHDLLPGMGEGRYRIAIAAVGIVLELADDERRSDRLMGVRRYPSTIIRFRIIDGYLHAQLFECAQCLSVRGSS